MTRSFRHQQAAAVAATVCALALCAAGAAQAAPASHHSPAPAGEVDRNLIKPPPGGMLAPATDLLGQLGLTPRP
ncbi:hypothetical protein [Streptomyces clavuligerus]|uniref:Secreted protein n=1 Tax=Streptomyces clavuligerus TaxID=1901 RepID=B5H1V0_STRCL|nr:hypothetical protein [Streptomyces clavuligerus]ANW18399.1 hypothetical protein BB341_09225 [Streptomyces clavuligerus]AXU12954.1 hypothetical protein D1794_09555 [Streptomyces clavuligerus]EDY52546.1 hypothetical protein SSCG_05553 [Streptomyces clavuligerus]EFG08975.1 Hypothetical protein SCLAV_3901 [Streptomyces clavuligerus]MBY6302882.1 hypothetical protein [Streptomyces clavuligerus]